MKKYIIFTLALFILGACSNEDKDEQTDMRNGESTTITLTGSINALSTRSTDPDLQRTSLVSGRRLGAWILDGTTNIPFYQNVSLVSGSKGTLTPDEDLLWGDHTSANIFSYHPFNAGWTLDGDNLFNVNSDQSTDDNYLNSDLLYGLVTGSNTGKLGINIPYSHKLTKISVSLLTDGVNIDLNGAIVNILGTRTSVTFNMGTGTIGQVTGEISTIKAATLTAEANMASAIIIPQAIQAGSKFIEVIIGERKFYYTPEEARTFNQKTEYGLTLRMADTDNGVLKLVGTTIEDWNYESMEGTAYSEDGGDKPDPQQKVEVGDYLYADGSYSSTLENDCVGIVFYINAEGNGGKAVSLDEVNVDWSTGETDLSCEDVDNGMTNTDKILSASNYSADTYPAAAFCTAKGNVNGKKWYLPAINEVKTLYDNRIAVNVSLAAVGATTLGASNYYLSSTERLDWKAEPGIRNGDIQNVNFADGSTNNCYKAGCSWASTRAVIIF